MKILITIILMLLIVSCRKEKIKPKSTESNKVITTYMTIGSKKVKLSGERVIYKN